MAIRAARGGGSAVRWTYGVLLTLCVALAVLVHHETAATSATHVMSASSMSMTDAASTSMPSAAHAAPGASHAAHAMPGQATPAAWGPPSAHSADAGGCSALGMQHCTTASITSVQLAVPAESDPSPLADLRGGIAGYSPAGAVGRAPPDLSVLSQLRI
ncbi:hypothetical protein [Streptomyces sp. NPDC046909]|uniref:hypothetical protein n=1 Tax=Streptomyces sp. NPDC046909 TaxID=3155617 RepID=UPI0033ECE947